MIILICAVTLAMLPIIIVYLVESSAPKPTKRLNDDLPPGYCRIDRKPCLHPEPEFDNCRCCRKWDEYKWKMDLWEL